MQGDELVLGLLSRQQESRLPRQNFPLNLPTNRRLCSTVGGRIVEGWAAHCCAVSAARSRAATMTNLARSSLAVALPALFGAAKGGALVKLFMICPGWSASGQPTTNQILLLISAISWHLCEHVEEDSRGRLILQGPPEANCPRCAPYSLQWHRRNPLGRFGPSNGPLAIEPDELGVGVLAAR